MHILRGSGHAKKTGNPRFAYDSYRRFIQMFSDVVMEMSKTFFEGILDEIKEAKGIKFDTELTAEDLKEIIQYRRISYPASPPELQALQISAL